jgi:histidine triad (HIT) family protein
MQPSIFTNIINGTIPCHKIYEDELTVAILDIHPIRPGRTLVIPKKQVDHFDDLDAPDYQAVFNTVKLVAQRLKAALGAERVCLRVEGFDIPHAHIHVIPCNKPSDFYNEHRMQQEPDHSALAAMAKQLQIGGANV